MATVSAEAGPSNTSPLTDRAGSAVHADPVTYYFDDGSTAMSDEEFHRRVERMIVQLVLAQGFEGIEASALDYLRKNVEDAMGAIAYQSHELSMTARRQVPSVHDAFAALRSAGPRIQPHTLRKYAKERSIEPLQDTALDTAARSKRWSEWLAPTDDWLPSDEEDEVSAVGDSGMTGIRRAERRKRHRRKLLHSTMDEVPAHLPDLPPKHTWLATPSYPVRAEEKVNPLDYIDIKVSSTRLTEASLRGLIGATENAAFSSRDRSKNDSVDADARIKTEGSDDGTLKKTDLSPSAQRSLSKSGSGQFAVPSTSAAQTPSAEDARPARKGRPLSLRLRTSSVNSISAQAGEGLGDAANAASPMQIEQVASPIVKRPGVHLNLHRASLSASLGSGPRTAAPLISPALASLRRSTMSASGRGSDSAGPWTSMPSQSYFTWGPPTPSASADVTPGGPLATPLTPGGFVYPPTPMDMYANGGLLADSNGAERDGVEVDEGNVTLPSIVNYKRSWYRNRHATVNGKQTEETQTAQ